jgi:hypothetical protein
LGRWDVGMEIPVHPNVPTSQRPNVLTLFLFLQRLIHGFDVAFGLARSAVHDGLAATLFGFARSGRLFRFNT